MIDLHPWIMHWFKIILVVEWIKISSQNFTHTQLQCSTTCAYWIKLFKWSMTFPKIISSWKEQKTKTNKSIIGLINTNEMTKLIDIHQFFTQFLILFVMFKKIYIFTWNLWKHVLCQAVCNYWHQEHSQKYQMPWAFFLLHWYSEPKQLHPEELRFEAKKSII